MGSLTLKPKKKPFAHLGQRGAQRRIEQRSKKNPLDHLFAVNPTEINKLLDERAKLMKDMKDILVGCAFYGLHFARLKITDEETRKVRDQINQKLATTHNQVKKLLDKLENDEHMTQLQKLQQFLMIGPEFSQLLPDVISAQTELADFMQTNEIDLSAEPAPAGEEFLAQLPAGQDVTDAMEATIQAARAKIDPEPELTMDPASVIPESTD